MVGDLLADLGARCRTPLDVILTLNVDEALPFDCDKFGFPLEIIRNAVPKGFGANHNAAFARALTERFCVLNPDIRFDADPFPPLLDALRDSRTGVAAPRVLAPDGTVDDSARRFPDLRSLALKALGRAPRLEYTIGAEPVRPDWVAGMFMLFRADTYRQLSGFDERYFLYYEDVDLCRRLRQAGYEAVLVPQASVVHYAQRQSRRSLRHFLWHATSLARFLFSRRRNGLR